MPERNLFLIFTSRLNELGVRYMVTGAVASIFYGEPRLTHDIDLVVELTPESAEKLVRAFPIEEFYCPPIEIIKLEVARPLRGHFNIIHNETGFKADVYVAGQDKLHQWALQYRKRVEIGKEVLWLAPVEYVISRKLEYYREGRSEKHLRDIANMMTLSIDKIDFEKLTEKIQELGLEREWEEAKKFI